MGTPKKTGAVVPKLKKPVAMMHIAGELTLVERKLANVLLLNAYQELLTKEEHTITARDLCTLLGWGEDSRNIDHLRKALNTLQTTLIKFDRLTKKGGTKWEDIQLLGRATIENGICTYIYDSELAKRMANPETAFGMIDIEIQNRFASGFALALYENCLRFKNVGSTGYHGIELWRELLGAEGGGFDDFKRLNGRVLNPSMKQVNQVSDIEISAQYKRENRKITEIRYSVTEKAQRGLDFSPAQDDFTTPCVDDALGEGALLQRLLKLGIGLKLAKQWITSNSLRAGQAADLVEQKTRSGDIAKNPAGYLRKLMEADGQIVPPPVINPDSKRATENSAVTTPPVDAALSQSISALSDADIERFAKEYLAGEGAGGEKHWDAEKRQFDKGVPSVRFRGWLLKRLSGQV